MDIVLLYSSDCSRKITSLIGSPLKQAVMRLSFISRVLNHPLPSLDAISGPCHSHCPRHKSLEDRRGKPKSLALYWSQLPRDTALGLRKYREKGFQGAPVRGADTVLPSGNFQNYKEVLLSPCFTHPTKAYRASTICHALFSAPYWRHSWEQKEQKYLLSRSSHSSRRNHRSHPPNPQPQP